MGYGLWGECNGSITKLYIVVQINRYTVRVCKVQCAVSGFSWNGALQVLLGVCGEQQSCSTAGHCRTA